MDLIRQRQTIAETRFLVRLLRTISHPAVSSLLDVINRQSSRDIALHKKNGETALSLSFIRASTLRSRRITEPFSANAR